jgi:fructuronate reductase
MRWQAGVDDAGLPFVVDDPLARETSAMLAAADGDRAKEVRGLLAIGAIFGSELPADADFVAELIGAYTAIADGSAAAAVRAFAERQG